MGRNFNISLVVDGLELTDTNLERLFGVLPDALPATIGGVTTIATPIEAVDAKAAALKLVDTIGAAFPEVIVVRVDQDLVSIPDVADRVGRSRESIRLLVEGKRGPGGFPAPLGIVGDGIRVWPWSSVAEWFASSMDVDLGERLISPEVAAEVDAILAGRRRHGMALLGAAEVGRGGAVV